MPNTDNHVPKINFQQIQQQLQATNKIILDNNKHFLEIADIGKSLQQKMASAIQVRNPLEGVIEQHQKFAEKFIEQFTESSRIFTDSITRLADGLQQVQEDNKNSLPILANIGWYIDPGMPFDVPGKCARAIADGDVQQVVEVLENYFRGQVDDIEKRLIAAYPNRQQIFEDAFNAHREGKFNLSVPVLLTQADGIWFDTFRSTLFTKHARRDAVGTVLSDDDTNSFAEQYMEPLFLPSLPLWQTVSEEHDSFTDLNRHLVLHGIRVDYGTQQNSLKAIAFLNYLEWVLNHTD